MIRWIALITLSLASVGALAADEVTTNNETRTVSVESKGSDVRNVIHDLFTQSKKNYVLEPNVRFVLYLSLKEMEFEEALQLICKTASLKYEIQNGIFFVNIDKPKTVVKPQSTPPKEEKPKGKLPETVLTKTLTTRFDKVEIKALFEEITKQTGVKIEIASGVPQYRLDAYLINTSLKYALDTVTDATGLAYKFTDNLTIQIYKPEKEANKVVIRDQG